MKYPTTDGRELIDVCYFQPELERYAWSEEMQGIILGAYYVGYVLMHLPGAMLAQRFGGQIVLVFSLGCAAVLTLLTPLAIEMGGAHALIAIRALIGTCQGGLWPALSAIMAVWVPLNERGLLGAFVFSGISVIMRLDGMQWRCQIVEYSVIKNYFRPFYSVRKHCGQFNRRLFIGLFAKLAHCVLPIWHDRCNSGNTLCRLAFARILNVFQSIVNCHLVE